MKILGFTITRNPAGNTPPATVADPGTAPAGPQLSPTQQLALMQAEHAAHSVMSAIRWAERLAWVVLLIVMGVSFEDQHHYLAGKGMRVVGTYGIPLAFDVATVLLVAVIAAAAMRRGAKIAALSILVLPTLGSGYINVMASPDIEVAIIYIGVVALIPGIELVKALMGPDYPYMLRIEQQLLTVAQVVEPAPAPAATTTTTSEWKKAVERATTLAEANPNLNVKQLIALVDGKIGRKKASDILDAVKPAAALAGASA